jgi:hypothetical protein
VAVAVELVLQVKMALQVAQHSTAMAVLVYLHIHHGESLQESARIHQALII